MNIFPYKCELKTEEPLFFASKEVSRTFITVPYTGNYALVYAMGIVESGYQASPLPRYREDLSSNNCHYVFPAKFVNFKWHMESFNCVGEGYFLQMGQNIVIDAQKYLEEVQGRRFPVYNSPQMGTFKMIASESVAVFYIFAKTKEILIPRYIRVGKLMTKCHLECTPVNNFEIRKGEFFVEHPLNPADLSREYLVKSYSTVSIKPIPLIERVQMEGEYITFDKTCLPLHVGYFLYMEGEATG
ncbi:MAG: CRISPR-associated protein Csc1 [Pseudothermotoga sp.]|nr:CRISPR-associated protein Csc1 [Pseudothermotoga sp.]MDI3516229.1 CRISPR-associated protein Csc1 [Thermotogota bacterium]